MIMVKEQFIAGYNAIKNTILSCFGAGDYCRFEIDVASTIQLIHLCAELFNASQLSKLYQNG